MSETNAQKSFHPINLFGVFSLIFILILIDNIYFNLSGATEEGILDYFIYNIGIMTLVCLFIWYRTANDFDSKTSHSKWQILIQIILLAAFAYFMLVEYLIHMRIFYPEYGDIFLLGITSIIFPIVLLIFIVFSILYRPFRLEKTS